MVADPGEDTVISNLKAENIKLLTENNVLRTDIGYWKSRHHQAVEREEAFKRELQDGTCPPSLPLLSTPAK